MKYPEATQAIRSWIAGRNLAPGSRLPSARLLAKQLGFHPSTLDRACQDLISKGSLVRRGYKLFVGAEPQSRPLIDGEVCVVSYANEKFNSVAARILAERGVKHREIQTSFTRSTAPAVVLRQVFAQKPAGVILWIPHWIESLKPLLEQSKIPVAVCADGVTPGLSQSTVGTDLLRATEIALRHLHDLGHRKIAYVSGPFSVTEAAVAANFRKVCAQLGFSAAIWQTEFFDDTAPRETVVEQRKRHPDVTAVFAICTYAAQVTKACKVPDELSVVSLFDYKPDCRPALTAVALREDACIASWACWEVISRVQAVESGRPMPPPSHALFVPELTVRESTRALARRETGKPDVLAIGPIVPISPMGRIGSMGRMAASPGESWLKTYAYLKRSRHHTWRQLDLSKLANHGMTRVHGWLGSDPLLHFSPGLRTIHGVKFQVIDENLNGGQAVVTFRSPQTHSTEGKELPVRVRLPVRGRVKALYFLHGCGYALAQPAGFAEYRIHFKTGADASVPLIPIGSSKGWARRHFGKLKPNVQDWWPGYEQRDFPHAKYVTVFNPADAQEYERYLYTLEWINPRPQEELSHIEARADPEAGPTLALIAVTALV